MSLSLAELRIGNWVRNKSGREYQIEYGDFTNMAINGTDDPIPLTEDWLLRFGFVKNEKTKYWVKYADRQPFGLHIYVHTTGDVICVIGTTDMDGDRQEPNIDYELSVKYIHDLQNLYFVLTGEELKFTNL